MLTIDVRSMSHITGGGLPGNVPRVLPEGLGLRLGTPWKRAPVFELVREAGGVSEAEMRSTFNLGVGYVIVVLPSEVERAMALLVAAGEDPFELGTIVRVPADRPFEERVEWPG